MEPTAVPGTPWEGEISLGNSSGGPPEDNNEFFFGPGGLRERLGSLPGRLLEPTWRPRGPRRPPGAILAPKMVPKWSPEASFLELFSIPWKWFFGALRPGCFRLQGGQKWKMHLVLLVVLLVILLLVLLVVPLVVLLVDLGALARLG